MFVPWPKSAHHRRSQDADRSIAYRISRTVLHLLPLLRHSRLAFPSAIPSPTVVLIPGLGMFSFGKNKTEARIVGEFYTNAIHVIEGATLLSEGAVSWHPSAVRRGYGASQLQDLQQLRRSSRPIEAFRIEYWAMEEAKLRRQPPEKELSRRIALIVGGGSGIGREVAHLAAARGAHVMVADSRQCCCTLASLMNSPHITQKEFVATTAVDIRSRDAIHDAHPRPPLLPSAASTSSSTPRRCSPLRPMAKSRDDPLGCNDRTSTSPPTTSSPTKPPKIFADQNLDGSIVLTSSANAVVPKRGSEAYDVSKAALSTSCANSPNCAPPKFASMPLSPATVVKGSTMFPRERVRASLIKYNIAFNESKSDDELRALLAGFYAKRTLTHQSHRSDRLRRSDSLPRRPQGSLHHRTHLSGRRWIGRGISPVSSGVPQVSHLKPGSESGRTSQPARDPRARIAIDLGAESCRVSLLRWIDDRPTISEVHRIPNGPVQRGSSLHWPLDRILTGIDEGLRQAAYLATEGIASIAVDGWAVDYVRLDEDGKPLQDPFCYRDERTIKSKLRADAILSPENAFRRTGAQPLRINTVYQLLADGPDIASARWICLPEYVLHRLGAPRIAEYTNATHTGLVDPATGTWAWERSRCARDFD